MRPIRDIVARIAARQHGRITRAQLLAAGVGPERVKRWVRDGTLRREHRGVYAFGHDAPSLLGELMAAVLAAGPGAVVSHAWAAHVLQLVRGRPSGPVELTVPTVTPRRRPGLRIHRVRSLPRLDVADHEGVPVTTVPRVLLDLAPRLSGPELTYAGHQAWVLHHSAPRLVEACIARNPRKPGAAKLRRALTADVTLSELEDGFLELLARRRLPLPRTNIDRAGDKVDCHWPDRDLTVELLSYRFHASRRGFEDDVARRRRSAHTAFTYGDVFERAAATVAEVAALLSSRPPERTTPGSGRGWAAGSRRR